LLILYAFGTEIVQAATSPVYQMFHWNERTFGMDDLFQDVSGEAIGVTLGAVGRFFFKLKTENE
jgi:hypothetical protein